MKIAVSSQGDKLDSMLDSRFGRAKGFIICYNNNRNFKYVKNTQNLNAVQGAGIQSAKIIVNKDVDILITGHVGPKAYAVLHGEGIEIYLCREGTVADAIADFNNNKLIKAESADVEAHW